MIGWIRTLHILSIVLGVIFFKTGIILYGAITSIMLIVLGLVLIVLGVYGFMCLHSRKESIREAEAEAETRHRHSDEVE